VALFAAILRRDLRPFALWLWLPLAVLAIMTMRKKSPRLALHSLLSWSENGSACWSASSARRTAREPRACAATIAARAGSSA
jgi:hypothetical protein